MSEFVRLWSHQSWKIKQLEVGGTRAPVPQSWRCQCILLYYFFHFHTKIHKLEVELCFAVIHMGCFFGQRAPRRRS